MRYLLLGYGISNQAVRKYFDTRKTNYILYDDYIEEYHKNIDLNSFEVIIKSPVIKNDHWLIKLGKQLNKKIITDLELFYRENPFKTYITVTGTNGKTTTVNLIATLLEDVDLGGNLGIPLFDFIHSPKDIVIEASSFMLEYLQEFHSQYSVFLNLSPNHLDHHPTYQEYIRCKMNLLKNIKPSDTIIYNYDDPLVRRIIESYDANLVPFSIKEEVNGAYVVRNSVYFKQEFILDMSGMKLLGNHNRANIAAAVAAALSYNPKIGNLGAKIREFDPIEHRLEECGRIGKIKVYNDSKSTNYRALKTALDAFSGEKILLICGGKIRVDSLDILDKSLKHVKHVLTNGENRNLLSQYFQSRKIPCDSFETLEEVMNQLGNYLTGISVVLFSPASVSYDQFKNYELRGEYFKTALQMYLNKNKN